MTRGGCGGLWRTLAPAPCRDDSRITYVSFRSRTLVSACHDRQRTGVSSASGTEPSGDQAAHGNTLLSELGLALGAEVGPRDTGPAGGRGLGGLGDRRDVHGAGRRGARGTRRRSCAWSSSSTRAAASTRASIATGSLPPGIRRASIAVPPSRSRGPISTRTGTPLSSQSTARRPKGVSVRSSTWTRRPAARELVADLAHLGDHRPRRP